MMAAGITGATLKGGLEIIAQVRAGQNPKVLNETQQTLRVKPQNEPRANIEAANIQAAAKRADLDAKLIAEQTAKKAALTLEKQDGGHSLDRHGPQITDAKLKSRLTAGIAPDGKFSPTKASTKFNSYEDWLQTRNAAWEQIQKTEGVDLSKAPAKGADTKHEIVIEYDRAIDDGFVGDSKSKVKVSDLTNLKKKGNGYPKYDAVDGITRTKTTVAWDASANKWKVVQHFPVAEDWNNITKTYNPKAKIDVKVTLPPKGGKK